MRKCYGIFGKGNCEGCLDAFECEQETVRRKDAKIYG